jgi:hypothetical protein
VNSLTLLLLSGVAVEKLLPAKFAKIKSRRDAPQSIFSGRLDIFYPPDFGCLGRKSSLSTAHSRKPRSMSEIAIFRELTAWIALKLLTFIDLRDL